MRVLMSGKVADEGYIRTVVQQIGAESVPQYVRRDLFIDACATTQMDEEP